MSTATSESFIADPGSPPVEADGSQHSRMTYSRLIGALFLAGFLCYGLGSGLVSSVVGDPNVLPTVIAQHSTLGLGALLMLANCVVDVGKGVLFFPILERYSKLAALAYLATMIVEVVLLAVGVLALLMIGPIAQQAADTDQAGAWWAAALVSLAVETNSMAYQIAEMMLGVGCILLCAVLLRARLIPRPLALLGLVGYPVLVTGAIAELFGTHIGLVLTIPGGLFEVVLAFWLLVQGFEDEPFSRVRERLGSLPRGAR